VAQLTKAFANEWARYGINVNAIAPGYMETDKHRGVAERPKAQPANLGTNSSGQMGHAARRRWGGVFLSSPAANYIHGHVLTVDGGWLAR
jgi:2-deoxy-D-gluconate 3-dehydrogenase